MASISVQQLQEGIETIRLSPPKDVQRGMRIHSLSMEDRPLLLKLAGDMQTVTVPFEPSVYNGTGDEPRKGIVFNITPELLEVVAQLEDTCRQLLGETIPNIDALCAPPSNPLKSIRQRSRQRSTYQASGSVPSSMKPTSPQRPHLMERPSGKRSGFHSRMLFSATGCGHDPRDCGLSVW